MRIKIALASDSNIKTQAVSDVFNTSEIDGYGTLPYPCPPQPVISYLGGAMSKDDDKSYDPNYAEKRVDHLVHHLHDCKMYDKYDFIIGIENVIRRYINNDNVQIDEDYAQIVIHDVMTDLRTRIYSQPVIVPKEWLDKTKDLDNHEYMGGWSVTVGEVIHQSNQHIPANNWMYPLCAVDRKDNIIEALRESLYSLA